MIVNVRGDGWKPKDGLVGCWLLAAGWCSARQGWVGRFSSRLSEPLEPQNLRNVSLKAARGVDEVCVPLPQSQPQSDVPYSAREGAGAGRRCQRAKGCRIRPSEQIGKFVEAAAASPGTLRECRRRLGVHAPQEAVRKLVDETGGDWQQGAPLSGPAQYRVSSLYCEANIRRRDGRRYG